MSFSPSYPPQWYLSLLTIGASGKPATLDITLITSMRNPSTPTKLSYFVVAGNRIYYAVF